MFQGMVLGQRAKQTILKSVLLGELCQRFSGVRSQPVIYETMPLGTTKATALSRLAEILKMIPQKLWLWAMLITISKCSNLQGLGIAMGNASDYVKSLADAVTASNEEDGVARAIEIYFIIKKPSSCQLGFDIKNS